MPQSFRFVLSAAYGAIAIIAVIMNAWLTPISMAPDEPSHFLRALQISEGHFVAVRRTPRESGGYFHEDTVRTLHALDHIKFHGDLKVTPELLAESHGDGWNGPIVFSEASGSAMNPPWSYPGVVAGISIGRKLNLTLWHTLFVSRILTGLLAVATTCLAITLCHRGIFFLTVVASLPMTMHLFGSCSQDAAVIACAFLMASLLSRLSYLTPPTWPQALGVGFCLVMLSAKPPMLVLILLPFALQRAQVWGRWLVSLAGAMTIVSGWLLTGFSWGRPKFDLYADGGEKAHLAHITFHPISFAAEIIRTLEVGVGSYCKEFIGVLGWLDAPLQHVSYAVSAVALLGTSLPFLRVRRLQAQDWRQIALTVMIMMTACLSVMVSLYFIFSPVRIETIFGIQGRYFIPISVFLILIMRSNDENALLQPALTRVFSRLTIAHSLLAAIGLVYTLHIRYWAPS